jgi:type II secretory pathway pseudopilin PulG
MLCSPFDQKGFSYLFTLLMVALLGLSLTLATDIYSTSVQRDKEKELLSIGRQFRSAIGRYYESNQKSSGIEAKKEYPNSMQDLLTLLLGKQSGAK